MVLHLSEIKFQLTRLEPGKDAIGVILLAALWNCRTTLI